MDEFLSFVTIDKWEMIFTWGNLLILYFIMKKFLFKPVRKMILEREKEVKDMYSEAEAAKESAESLKTEYEAKLSEAKTRSDEIIRDSVRNAHLKEEDILREAQAKAARTMQRAEEEITLEKKKALDDVKDEISSMAVGIASRIIEKDITESDHEKLIKDFIDGME